MSDKYLSMCRKVPVKRATTPRGGLTMIIDDCWWLVVDDCILFHRVYGTPQCNSSEHVARTLRDRLCKYAEVVHIPFVFQPTTAKEWIG